MHVQAHSKYDVSTPCVKRGDILFELYSVALVGLTGEGEGEGGSEKLGKGV